MSNGILTLRQAFAAVLIMAAMSLSAHAKTSVPHIQDVAFSGRNGNLRLTITGTDFGAVPDGIPCTACSPLQLQIVDIVSQPRQETINVTSWSDTSITVTGVAAQKGDSMRVAVYNQTLGNVDTWGGPAVRQKNGTPIIDCDREIGRRRNPVAYDHRLGLRSGARRRRATSSIRRFSFSPTTMPQLPGHGWLSMERRLLRRQRLQRRDCQHSELERHPDRDERLRQHVRQRLGREPARRILRRRLVQSEHRRRHHRRHLQVQARAEIG